MRTVIHFEVTGDDRADLEDKALGVYRDVVGNPDAELPHSATIEIFQQVADIDQSGNVTATVWRGEVTVSEAAR